MKLNSPCPYGIGCPIRGCTHTHQEDPMTPEQRAKIVRLGGDPATFHPVFDLPAGWVAGWANGVYYGINPEGEASS